MDNPDHDYDAVIQAHLTNAGCTANTLHAAVRQNTFDHLWHGQSPHIRRSDVDGDIGNLQRQCTQSKRKDMSVLLCTHPILLSTKSKMVCAKKFLQRSQHGKIAKHVQVHRHGLHKVPLHFRGIVWVGTCCAYTDGNTFRILRVCKRSDVRVTWLDSLGQCKSASYELEEWSSTSKAIAGQLIAIECRAAKRCLRTWRDLEKAYTALARPSTRMIYARGAVDTFFVALINKKNRMVCATCNTEFTQVRAFNNHFKLLGRWSSIEWKRYDQTSNLS